MKFKMVFFDCDGVLLKDPIPWKRLHRAGGISKGQDKEWWSLIMPAGLVSHNGLRKSNKLT